MATDDDDDAARRLERLFDAYADRVHAFATHRVGPDSARDVVSETFLVAWRRFDTVPDRALPWLLGTARKVISNELRGRARRSALADRLAASRINVPEGPSDTKHDVESALEKLDQADQEVLVLSAWYDLTGIEAARVLGCAPGTYAVRLHRARRRLRRELTRDEHGWTVRTPSDQEAPS